MVRPAPISQARVQPRRRRRGQAVPTRAGFVLGLAFSLSACLVGPNYRTPSQTMPPSYAEAAPTPTAQVSAVDPDWWKSFKDPALDALMEQALQTGPSLAEAEARVRQARAFRDVVDAAQYPTALAGAEYARSHGSANVPIGVPPGVRRRERLGAATADPTEGRSAHRPLASGSAVDRLAWRGGLRARRRPERRGRKSWRVTERPGSAVPLPCPERGHGPAPCRGLKRGRRRTTTG